MTSPRQEALMRRALLAAWGMATVVLVFLVLILVWALFRQHQPPAMPPVSAPGAVTTADGAPLAAKMPDAPAATREITLYFADADGRTLLPETAQIEFDEYTVENCRKALEALIKGPKGGLTPVLPASTRVLSLFLLESGELVVNFSIELETELKKSRSASLEALLVQSVVDTVAQPVLQGSKEGRVTSVRLLIENAAPRESFPAHVDVSAPIAVDAAWVAIPQSMNGQG